MQRQIQSFSQGVSEWKSFRGTFSFSEAVDQLISTQRPSEPPSLDLQIVKYPSIRALVNWMRRMCFTKRVYYY